MNPPTTTSKETQTDITPPGITQTSLNAYHLSSPPVCSIRDLGSIKFHQVLDQANYQLRFRSTVIAASDISTFSDGKSSFKARVDAGFIAEVKNLESTINFLIDDDAKSTLVPLINDDKITIKLPTYKNGKFDFMIKCAEGKDVKTIDDLRKIIEVGTKLEVIFKVGGYWSQPSGAHGLYLVLTEILNWV